MAPPSRPRLTISEDDGNASKEQFVPGQSHLIESSGPTREPTHSTPIGVDDEQCVGPNPITAVATFGGRLLLARSSSAQNRALQPQPGTDSRRVNVMPLHLMEGATGRF